MHLMIQKMPVSDAIRRNFHDMELGEILDDEVHLEPTETSVEMLNRWTIRFEQKTMTPRDITCFFHAVVAARSNFLRLRFAGRSAVFYAWYDAQAGYLAFSLMPNDGRDLPFKCTVVPVKTCDEIVAEFFADPHPDFIPWEELTPVSDDDDGTDEPDPKAWHLKVWSIVLPLPHGEALGGSSAA
jgi:hypothetical protein